MLAALPLAAHAAPDTEMQQLREELQRLKADYERRVESLERRIAESERSTAPSAAAAPASPSAFNPEISVILSGMYTGTSQDPRLDPTGATGRERRIQGRLPSGGEFNPEARSWNLGESELAFSANIDPMFRGTLLAALSPANELSVEEANIRTIGLDHGLGLKAGRFFSGIGYANEQHPHAWDFSDAALPYQAFFGPQLGYDGVQVKWLAPTALFLEIGAEAGRARGFPANDESRNKNGLLSGSVFAHIGGDVGVSNSWRAGLSVAGTRPRERGYDDVDSTGTLVSNSFTGTSNTTVLDVVWKWAPAGNASERSFTFQGEWMRRHENGLLTYDTAAASFGTATDGFRATQTGWYAQGVYKFAPRWRFGYRYDELSGKAPDIGLIANATLTAADLPLLQAFKPRRHTAMVDWTPSEFSRVRFQLARDQTRPGRSDDQFWIHYIVSMGAHGAHKF
jgi:hypothetical protein